MRTRRLGNAGWLMAILVVAAVLRLRHITQPFDDAVSWRQSSVAMIAENYYRNGWNIFYPEINWAGVGPSYHGREFQTVSYIAALLYLVTGQHDWVGRCVAVAFGLWGLVALYYLVRRLWDERHALAATAVMALMPGSIFTDRSFIPDPAMLALMLTSFWMLIAYLDSDRARFLAISVAIGAWGVLTKLPGIVLGLPILHAALALRGRTKLGRIALGAVVAMIPVIAYYLWAVHLARTYPPYHFAGAGHWLWDDGIAAWWGQSYFLPLLEQRLSVWTWTVPVIALACVGLCAPPRLVSAPWVFHWWLVAGLVYYAIGAEELVNHPWNFHVISPAIAALSGRAIILAGSFPLAFVTRTVVLFVIAFHAQSQLRWLTYPYAKQTHGLGLALRQVSQPGDLVITVANAVGDPTAIYYSGRRGWVFPPAGYDVDWTELPADDAQSIRLFEHLRAEGADWFGIVAEHEAELREKHRALAELIARTCEPASKTADWTIYRILPIAGLTPTA